MKKYLLINTDNEEIYTNIFSFSELNTAVEYTDKIADINGLEINENIDISDERREYIIRIL